MSLAGFTGGGTYGRVQPSLDVAKEVISSGELDRLRLSQPLLTLLQKPARFDRLKAHFSKKLEGALTERDSIKSVVSKYAEKYRDENRMNGYMPAPERVMTRLFEIISSEA